ncbi:hypothetical protein NZK35_22485 [Stieleria sp. ICT_E10.1]|uniref:hypothetical protein n=1 Tax=Stieleria sedimenti TaxID=2976331 RepID=UPI0021803BAA|nr:hypothetical protein [Stieleria sedimenti]MCS7469430.1 hypothetical protein [Stieleria sedimenti]
MLFNLSRLRKQWRGLHARVERLEHQLKETDGIVDALLSDAQYTPHRDLGMNGQHRRKEVVEHLFDRLGFEQVIETGTFLGATTGYFATTFGVPVYTSELISRNHHFAKRSLRNISNIELHLQDSRSFLRDLSQNAVVTEKRTFFYLDAHWYDDLPLEDEIDILAPVWNNFVILIDDFQVPQDPGYQYDDYGPGQSLTMDYLDPIAKRHQLSIFFPRATSSEETGKRRGYCVVASATLADDVRTCELLVAN